MRKVRANEIRIGQQFKKSEAYFGTTTFECIGSLRKSLASKSEYKMEVRVIKSTGNYYKAGQTLTIFFAPRYNRFTQVTLVK